MQGLLFLSPIMPDETGNGLAMRAGLALGALARRFEVHLGLVPVAGGSEAPSSLVRACAASVQSLPLRVHLDPHFQLIERVADPEEQRRLRLAYPKPLLCRFCTSRSEALVAQWCASMDIRAVHVLRLYLAPLVERAPFCGSAGRPLKVLDLDEDEVATRRSLARLHRAMGAAPRAAEEEREADKYATLMARVHRAFDRILVSSPLEEQRVRSSVPELATAILPNAAPRVARAPRAGRGDGSSHRVLFVGNLGYAPNEEAVIFLCQEIIPRLRASLARPLEVMIAGGGASPELATTAARAGATLLGAIDDLAPLYAAADLALVPLRAGGGTRIKALEAFAHGTPVVATSVGIEGLSARAGEHALVADTPEGFAAACNRLLTDQALATALSARAQTLVDGVYRADRVEAALLGLYDRL